MNKHTDWLDEILHTHFLENEAGESFDYAKQAIKSHIREAGTKARIDELESIDWKTEDGGFYFVKDRLAELRAEEKLL